MGGRKKNWGRGRGRGKKNPVYFSFPAPTPSDILAFSPQFSQSPANPKWRLNTRKPPKPPALQASVFFARSFTEINKLTTVLTRFEYRELLRDNLPVAVYHALQEIETSDLRGFSSSRDKLMFSSSLYKTITSARVGKFSFLREKSSTFKMLSLFWIHWII